MAIDVEATKVRDEEPQRDPGLRQLNRLVGTWKVSGESEGETTYEWMEGGHFLIQRGVVRRGGTRWTYLGVIGYEHAPGTERADAITSRIYTSQGDTLDYTSEMDGDSLTIWFGKKGSPSVYHGKWSDDDSTLTGAWEWPGGGYSEVMTRVTQPLGR